MRTCRNTSLKCPGMCKKPTSKISSTIISSTSHRSSTSIIGTTEAEKASKLFHTGKVLVRIVGRWATRGNSVRNGRGRWVQGSQARILRPMMCPKWSSWIGRGKEIGGMAMIPIGIANSMKSLRSMRVSKRNANKRKFSRKQNQARKLWKMTSSKQLMIRFGLRTCHQNTIKLRRNTMELLM